LIDPFAFDVRNAMTSDKRVQFLGRFVAVKYWNQENTKWHDDKKSTSKK